ncbi:MAG: hypothetical protein KGM17_08790 [Sphingomonadales bacterium]|nr:hypothetical protein [Sphingomonadales bacterium]
MLDRMVDHRPALRVGGSALAEDLRRSVRDIRDPLAREFELERCAREIRALWLRGVAAETSRVLRSPTEREASRIAVRHDTFGYERDLQPEELEARCDRFFPPPPAPWQSQHVLFSSGQAALLGVLLALRPSQPLRVRHLGGYFETRRLIETCPALCASVDAAADVVIAEPVASDGGFDVHRRDEIIRATVGARALVVDTTLLGRDDGLDRLLAGLERDMLVLRCASGLKLLQAGLELASVGIVGVHSRSGRTLSNFAGALREMRTLCGTGLRFVDALALEAPFVFDPTYADRYAGAIFAHNAALAEAAASGNRLFVLPFAASPSPYCVFSLREGDDQAYERLADLIAAEATARKLAFERGGSFGFRGHRYEIVRPEDKPPFLRIAMGRRGGWTFEGVKTLMADIAARPAI